jgi:hypothetical protein
MFVDSVGFYALHPIITFDRSYACDATDEHGDIDLSADTLFIYALKRCPANAEPFWHTSLITRASLMENSVIDAMKAAVPIPSAHVNWGGRNGVLISAQDPSTEAVLDEWFTTPHKYKRAYGYTERIRHTPPELRTEFHQRALERWDEMRAARRQEDKGKRTKEPTPFDHVGAWRGWLHNMRISYAKQGKTFSYPGVPLVCQSYQIAHLEALKAILLFTPRSGGPSIRDPLRNAFLRATAALLSVPDLYQEVLAQLRLDVDPQRQRRTYDAAKFGDEHSLGINHVARFLASIGVPATEAEQWRPWAAAYVDMELDEHPQSDHAPMMRRAQEQARERIDIDPSKVVTRVHRSSPGYYNPNNFISHSAQQPEDNSSNNAEAGTSSTTLGRNTQRHPDDAEEVEVSIGYGDDLDEDTAMGPG